MLPQWSPLLGGGTTCICSGVGIIIPVPQWSPLLGRGTTRVKGDGVTEGPVAAMEPAARRRDDGQGAAERIPGADARWSPLGKSRITGTPRAKFPGLTFWPQWSRRDQRHDEPTSHTKNWAKSPLQWSPLGDERDERDDVSAQVALREIAAVAMEPASEERGNAEGGDDAVLVDRQPQWSPLGTNGMTGSGYPHQR